MSPFSSSTLPSLMLLFLVSFGKGEGLAQNNSAQFEKLNPKSSGVTFKNQLKEDRENNILRYEYFYNGAGVAIG